jgi:di/tricarboxylate transporter
MSHHSFKLSNFATFEWPELIVLLLAICIIIAIGLLLCLCMLREERKEKKYDIDREEVKRENDEKMAMMDDMDAKMME